MILTQVKKPVNVGEFINGWKAYCNGDCLDIETDSSEFRRGFATAFRVAEMNDPHGLHEFWDALRSNEQTQMDADLDAMRSGDMQPMTRLTDAQMAAIEEERPGSDFCERPYLF